MSRVHRNEPVALVTGASRGLGLEFTRQLLERGDHVFAAARNPAGSPGLTGLAAHHGDRLNLVALDVADPVSIDAMHAHVAARTDQSTCSSTTPGSTARASRNSSATCGSASSRRRASCGWCASTRSVRCW